LNAIAIMQPYFCPYIGYFQLINAVDVFVIYDNIEYTKKGWINRNRLLADGQPAGFSIPLKKASDFLQVKERFLADDFNGPRLLNRIRGAYAKAPHFDQAFPLVEAMVLFGERNLFDFVFNSVGEICRFLGISTRLVKSSEVVVDHELKGQEKVLAICKALGAERYINPIGGRALYARDVFRAQGLDLGFLQTGTITYRQFGAEFVEFLSIIDVLMFNARDEIARDFLGRYELV